MTEQVVVSRKWSAPEITAFVTDGAVGAAMALDDYLKALAAEVGNPATLLTVNALAKALAKANYAVLAEMKATTRYVV